MKQTSESAQTPQARVVIDDPNGVGEAARWAGQPTILFARLERAVQELQFFKNSLRHHNEREANIVKTHDEWRRSASALARQLADDIDAGLLEPNLEIKRKLDLAQALVDDALRLQRGE